MPLIRYQDKIVLFVHIPKTGGTSVEDALKEAGATVALRYGSRFKGFMKSTFQHLTAEIHEAVIPHNFYDDAFALVRHPVPRLLSAYRYRHKRGDSPMPFDDWVNKAFDAYGRNPYAFDNHIRPQVDFLLSDMTLFRLEEGLDLALQHAEVKLGLPRSVVAVHRNKTAQKAPVKVSAATWDRVLKFYAADFARLGYDSEEKFADIKTSLLRRWRQFLPGA